MRAGIQAVVFCVVCGGIVAARADNWPTWRGTGLDGVARGVGYVTQWQPPGETGEPGQNILWRVKLPGLGASTPAVWGERIVVTCGI